MDLVWIDPGTFTMGSPEAEEGRDAGGEDEALVVFVDHDHDSDCTRGDAPTRLPRDGGLAVLILEVDVEHLR